MITSGSSGAFTPTTTSRVLLVPPFETVRRYVVVALGLTVTEPDGPVTAPTPGVIAKLEPNCVDQLSV
ncbi:MAG: hypothetical protein ACREKL_17110, partial [Chthoniobacterales bacterium]